MTDRPSKFPTIRAGANFYQYNDPHDILGIIETAIFDVYGSQAIKSGYTVLDIVAGIGDFTVVASRRVRESGKVIAVEPSSEDYDCLLANIKLNGLRNVVPINAAVSDEEKEVAFEFKGRTVAKRARRLRDLLLEHNVGLDEVRFTKMDIEGVERAVVPESLDILGRCDRVAMELHDGSGALLDPLLRAKGFIFCPLRRRDYLLRLLRFVLRHPLQARRIYAALRRARPQQGITRLLSVLEIATGSSLVIGTYVNGSSGLGFEATRSS